MGFIVEGPRTVEVRSVCDVSLRFDPDKPLKAGARFWLYYDVRQAAGNPQTDCSACENYITARNSNGNPIMVEVLDSRERTSRTYDFLEKIPEFHNLVEFCCTGEELTEHPSFTIEIKRWKTPENPIDPFRFWLLVDYDAQWKSVPTGFRTHRKLASILTGELIPLETLRDNLYETSIAVKGSYRPIVAANRRKTPGVYWGELHGMAFNQRPLDDFYNYAKNVTELDFAAAIKFSYNISMHDYWEQFKEAARRHTEPGRFVALVGFETGTPPDDSHRCAYFPHFDDVPPIFADSRSPAHDPTVQERFHPATVMCKTLEDFYAAVDRYGGFVGGHFHTKSYHKELLAEIWQKQYYSLQREEQRLFEYMKGGLRMGIVGGSDTHDSMPGNPHAEPGCPRPAGFTGVWAEQLTPQELTKAILAKRVFATTGARILLRFESDGNMMGSELSMSTNRGFAVKVSGTSELESVELLRDGYRLQQWECADSEFETEFEDSSEIARQSTFYLVRVRQRDGHLAWSSPIWFG